MELEDYRKHLIDEHELRRLVLAEAKKHKTKSDFARSIDIYPSFLHNYLTGTRYPGTKILNHMGYEEVTLYRKILP